MKSEKIKEFVKTTEDLKESRDEVTSAPEYADNIIRSMTESLIVVSSEGIIQTVNAATCALLGYEEKEIIGQPVGKIVEEEEEQQQLFKGAGIEDLIKKGSLRNVEKAYLSKDGAKIPVLFSGSVMRADDGKIQGIVCVAQDITELKRLQEREKEVLVLAERAATIDAMIDGVLVHDLEGKIMSANKPLEDMADYKKEEYLGKSLFEFVKPEESQKARAELTELLETGKVGPQGAILPTKNGRGIPVQTVGSLMRDAKGNPAYGVVVIRDIRERKQAEEQMRGLIGDTLNAQEAERERICLEVHDGVTQTLASAFQYLQTLESASLDGSNARKLLLRASALVRQAIQESREVINSLQPVTLRDLGLVATLRQETRQLEQEMRWRVDFKADVIRLPNDVETGLYRIIREAITNVRKHADTKRLRVRINTADNLLKVEVRDWGIGFNYDPQAIGRRKGTGLISMRKRAELMQGVCDIESTPGQGTTVRVEIPFSSYKE